MDAAAWQHRHVLHKIKPNYCTDVRTGIPELPGPNRSPLADAKCPNHIILTVLQFSRDLRG